MFESVADQPPASEPLAGHDVACVVDLVGDELLDGMTAAQRQINALSGRQLALAAQFAHRRPAPEQPVVVGGARARWEGVSEFAGAEIACALRISQRAADRLLCTALGLARLPATTAALVVGDIDLSRAQAIVDGTRQLDDEQALAVEQLVLPRAGEQVLSEVFRSLRRAVLAIASPTAEEQHAAIREERRRRLEHDGDGRSRLVHEGPTRDILRFAAAEDALARRLDPSSGTFDQRRFDAMVVMANTVLDDPSLPRTRFGAPGIVLLADVTTLTRLRDEPTERSPSQRFAAVPSATEPPATGRPVELLGDGPIPDGLARALLGDPHTVVIPWQPDATWTCDHGRTLGYDVPDRFKRHLAGLHRRCVFPGCGQPVHRCDWDHVVPYPKGPTCPCNLLPECRFHHRLKTHGGWQVAMLPDRHVRWTTPAGRVYVVRPDG